jgi:tetratricopeptide (TPR) repeat protein
MMIFTFYSYKGGVGRSMALANVAEWLYLQGLRVVMIDWDLEAPGLENYFYHRHEDAADLELIQSQLGLIDLLIAYKRQFPHLPWPKSEGATLSPEAQVEALKMLEENLLPLSTALFPIHAPGNSPNGRDGALWLLPAGLRAKDRFAAYAQAVQTFDWSDFYADFQGELYFDWLRRQLLTQNQVDIVLIDSRTGVTEMGGVCTRQMADVVVSFCVPNAQNLRGVEEMARSFTRPEIIEHRQRPLDLVIVPTRIDISELADRNAFEQLFRQHLDPFTPASFRNLETNFWELRIPYVPKYAYSEKLAIKGANHTREVRPDRSEELEDAYRKISLHLGLLARGESHQTIWHKLEPEMAKLFGDRLPLVAVDNRMEQAFSIFAPTEQDLAARVLKRLVRLAPPNQESEYTRNRLRLDEFGDERQIIEKLVAAHIINLEGALNSTEATVQLADEKAVKGWHRLSQWIKDDYEFLFWRQFLRTNLAAWERTQHDQGALLSGALLETAQSWQSKRAADLNQAETNYIKASAAHAHQQQRVQPRAPHSQAFAPEARSNRIGRGLLVLAAVILLGFFGLFSFLSRRSPITPTSPTTSVVSETKDEEARANQIKAQGYYENGKKNSDAKAALEDYKAAVDFATKALEVAPKFAPAYFTRANAQQGLGNYEAAVADYQQALANGATAAETYLNLGNAFVALKQYDKALTSYSQALEKDAQAAEALNNRGKVYVELKQYDQAQRDFDRAIQLKADFGEAYFNRAQLAQLRNNRERAVADYRKSTELPLEPNKSRIAKQQLRTLGAAEVTLTVTNRIFLHFQNADDADRFTKPITAALGKRFVIEKVQTIPNARTVGDVRYFYVEDQQAADTIRTQIQRVLLKNQIKLALQPIFIGERYTNEARGKFEVWIPSLATYEPKPEMKQMPYEQNAPYQKAPTRPLTKGPTAN